MTMIAYAGDRAAPMIVDPYSDFMSEGGKFYETTRKTAEAVGFCDNMRKLNPAIRAAGIQVVIVPHHLARRRVQGGSHRNQTQVRASQSQNFAGGSWGGEFHPEFGPREGDVIVLEHWGQSGFAFSARISPCRARAVRISGKYRGSLPGDRDRTSLFADLVSPHLSASRRETRSDQDRVHGR